MSQAVATEPAPAAVPAPNRNRRRLLLLAAIAVVLVVAISLVAVRYLSDRGTAPPTVRIDRGPVVLAVSATGNIAPSGQQSLGFPDGGTVRQVAVKVGDKVAPGQMLARIDDTTARQTLAQRRATLDQQIATLQKLQGGNSVESAQASLSQARDAEQKTRAQVSATTTANRSATARARTELQFDQSSLDRAEDQLRADRSSCDASPSGSTSQTAAAAGTGAGVGVGTGVNTGVNTAVPTGVSVPPGTAVATGAPVTTGAVAPGGSGGLTTTPSAGSVTTGSVTTGSVTTGSVTTGSAGTGSFTTGSASTGSVTTSSVTNGSVTTSSAGRNSVSTGSAGTGSLSTGSAGADPISQNSVSQSSVTSDSSHRGSRSRGSSTSSATLTADPPSPRSADVVLRADSTPLGDVDDDISAADEHTGAACSRLLSDRQSVQQAQASVVSARSTLDAAQQREKTDAASGQVSISNAQNNVVSAQSQLGTAGNDRPKDIRGQQAQVDDARAGVALAQQDLDQTVITAPVAGTITAINGTAGEVVGAPSAVTPLAPGGSAPLPVQTDGTSTSTGGGTVGGAPGSGAFLVLDTANPFQLIVPFEEADAARVVPGQNVDVAVDALPDDPLTGQVMSVAPAGQNQSGIINYYATVVVQGGADRLRDGQTAEADVRVQSVDNVLRVPTAAVRRDNGRPTVTVAGPDGKPVSMPFLAGLVGDDFVEVRSGLPDGAQVELPQATVTPAPARGGPPGN